MRTKMTLLAAAATAAVFFYTVTAAVAVPDNKTPDTQPANEPSPVTLAHGLMGPLHVSAGRDGALTVSEEFASRLTRIDAQGTKSVIYSNPGWDVAGIAQQGSTTYLLESQGAGPEDKRPLAGHVRTIDGDGHQNTFGDFAALEKGHNADGDTHYGFRNLPAECAALLPAEVPAAYTGEVDSHPYGLAVSRHTAYVADAGANSVVSIDLESGQTGTVAVLPPRPLTISAAAAAANHLPDCVVGRSYRFEAVPTDVAVGPDGCLYVTSLPGGPEDPSSGARGTVFKVDPDDGDVQVLADKIMSPTGLAVDDEGDVFVASLFGNGILRIDGHSGRQSTLLSAASVADVDLHGSMLYATVNTLPPDGAPATPLNGQIVSVDLKHGSHNRGSDD